MDFMISHFPHAPRSHPHTDGEGRRNVGAGICWAYDVRCVLQSVDRWKCSSHEFRSDQKSQLNGDIYGANGACREDTRSTCALWKAPNEQKKFRMKNIFSVSLLRWFWKMRKWLNGMSCKTNTRRHIRELHFVIKIHGFMIKRRSEVEGRWWSRERRKDVSFVVDSARQVKWIQIYTSPLPGIRRYGSFSFQRCGKSRQNCAICSIGDYVAEIVRVRE